MDILSQLGALLGGGGGGMPGAVPQQGGVPPQLGALMQMFGGGGMGGGGQPPMAPPMGAEEGLQPMRAQGPTEPPAPLPRGAGEPSAKPSDEEEIEAMHKEAGLDDAEGEEYQWEGDEESGPSPADLKYMKENPTDGVLEDFEKHFGYPPDAGADAEPEAEE